MSGGSSRGRLFLRSSCLMSPRDGSSVSRAWGSGWKLWVRAHEPPPKPCSGNLQRCGARAPAGQKDGHEGINMKDSSYLRQDSSYSNDYKGNLYCEFIYFLNTNRFIFFLFFFPPIFMLVRCVRCWGNCGYAVHFKNGLCVVKMI